MIKKEGKLMGEDILDALDTLKTKIDGIKFSLTWDETKAISDLDLTGEAHFEAAYQMLVEAAKAMVVLNQMTITLSTLVNNGLIPEVEDDIEEVRRTIRTSNKEFDSDEDTSVSERGWISLVCDNPVNH